MRFVDFWDSPARRHRAATTARRRGGVAVGIEVQNEMGGGGPCIALSSSS